MPDLKPVPGYEGMFATACGRVFSNKSGHLKEKAQVDFKGGYKAVGFYDRSTKKDRLLLVHRAVCLAFYGVPKPHQTDVRHLDGDPKNNLLENLRWGTKTENALDTVRHGRNRSKTHPEERFRGVDHPRRKLDESQVMEIKALRNSGLSQASIANKFNIHQGTVSKIQLGVTWAHMPKEKA